MQPTKTQQAKAKYRELREAGILPTAWFTGLVDSTQEGFEDYTGRPIWVSRHDKAYYLDEMGATHLDNIIQNYRRHDQREPYVVKVAWEKRLELEHVWRQRREADDRVREAIAMNIVHQIGDALYEALPPQIAHDHFVTARQATNDTAIDFTKRMLKKYDVEIES